MERNENGLFVTPRGGMGNFGMPTTPREGCGSGNGTSMPIQRDGCGNGNGTSMPIQREGYGLGNGGCNNCSRRQLAMVYAPMQCFRMLYSHSDALMRGTLFEELDKPLEEGM